MPKSSFKEEDYLRILFNSNHADHPENSFIFILTTEDEQVMYGICVFEEELINADVIDKWDTRKVRD